ncbi:putative ABC transporter permease subunit [Frisingicoccus sp.]|uniref:putative ABC transporter permease subunit n=1 Tax=Frisingicoccus sp. TaxID=1918627 RepID=UPI002E767D2F|nr:hypothetical protein [Frisingicoccus sp.]MEE0752978.1 hypothetical protein [Frisingicoccus sp.]
MRRFLALTRVLLKNGQNPNEKKKKPLGMAVTIFVRLIALALVIGIFCLLLFTARSGFPADMEGRRQAVMQVFTMDIVLVLISGIPLILSYFFLSRDVFLYIHMPFRGREIVGAKLVMAMMSGVVVSLVVVIPEFIGFGMKGGYDIGYYVLAVFVALFIPVIPTIIISALAILLMNLLKHMKNKETVVTVVSYGIMAAVLLSSMAGNSGDGGFLDALVSGSAARMVTVILCPVSHWGVNALICGDSIGTVLFFTVNILSVIIFMIFADAFYIKSALAVGDNGSGKSKAGAPLDFHPASVKTALFHKENRMFFRSPVYVMNSLTNMLMIPVVVIVAVVTAFMRGGAVMDVMNHPALLPAFTVFLPIVLCWLFGMTASMNRITPTSISREGEGFYLLKAMPVKLRTLYQMKKRPGFLLSLGVCGVMALAACVFIFATDISLVIPVMLLVETIAIVTLTNNIQMVYACKRPMLVWDTEETAIRRSGALETLSFLGGILLAGTVVSGLILFLHFGAVTAAGFWCLWVVAAALTSELVGTNKGIKMLKKIGE